MDNFGVGARAKNASVHNESATSAEREQRDHNRYGNEPIHHLSGLAAPWSGSPLTWVPGSE